MKLVIKIGGSMMNHPYMLRQILKRISVIAEQSSVLVVPGGGFFANQIRDLHTRSYLSNSGAHWLAIKCMDLYGSIMSDIQPSLSIYSGADAFDKWAGGESFIIQSYELLKSYDRLPHSWDVTGDSIALWMGMQGNADAVIILKSVNPFTRWLKVIQSETEAVKPESFQHLISREIIDRYMAQLYSKFEGELYVLNGLWPENMSAILARYAQ
ncbi:MAG: amino acid kinase family protein [Candidatus Thorarchaeota archaeon]